VEPSPRALVSVVIPTWNQEVLTRNLLQNLQQQTVQPLAVYVVDNGSSDHTAAVARQFGAHVIRFETNQGFAAAVNAGIQAAETDWVFILNNDVELRNNWLAVALEAAAEENARFVTGKLLQARNPDRIDGAWDLVSQAGCAWRCGFNAPDGKLWNHRRPIQMASLTALLVHRSVFERIGVLDSRYESYYEDVDFGLRSALAGFGGIYEPKATATHIGSATLGRGARTAYLVSRNQVLLAHKFSLGRFSLARLVWGQALFLFTRLRERTLWAALKGKRDGLRLRRVYPKEQVNGERLHEILRRSEQEIFQFQQATKFDLSWKLYFKLFLWKTLLH
jgi:GT2 family glycosyltransferase